MLKFIEEEFQLRCYDRFQIFLNVCPKMNYELPEEIKVANWIHNIKYFQSQRLVFVNKIRGLEEKLKCLIIKVLIKK